MTISLKQVNIGINLMVTTSQKPTIDTQKTKRMKPKHNIKENQTTREETRRRRKGEGRTIKMTRKQVTKWQ